MTEAFPLLSLLIWLPIFGGVMVWVVGDGQVAAAKRLALGFTVAHVGFIVMGVMSGHGEGYAA